MAPHDSFEDDRPVAPEHIQNDISAMLRRAAAEDASGPGMPADVALRIREALAAEQRSVSRETGASERRATVVPLPTRGSTPHRAESGRESVDSLAPPTAPERPRAQHGSDDAATQAARFAPMPPAPGTSHPTSGSGVTALEEHRRKRSRRVRTASLVAAAAAVAVVGGAVLATQSHVQQTTPVAASGPDVRFTQTNTDYTEASFDSQAAKLSNDTIPQMDDQALTAQHVDRAASKSEVNACISQVRDRLTKELANKPEKVTVDFGSFEGKPAIILLLEKDGKKQSFAINRSALANSCPTKSDILHSGAVQS